jgi:hypothetical protein
MIRALSTWWARWKYVFAKEHEAALNEWSARVAEKNAKMSRDLIAKLKQDADDLEARIKNVADMEEKGFWLCENGHEFVKACSCAQEGVIPIVHSEMCWLVDKAGKVLCRDCNAEAKFVKRSEMTGQEKYESDKGRKEAEDLLTARREEITGKETEADQQDAAAKYFRQQSQSSRKLADSLRKL